MRLCSDRRYSFDCPPPTLWAALTRIEQYQSWWPWLRDFDANSFTTGARWTCVIQPPIPYSLRFGLTLEEVVPDRSAAAVIHGDIEGWARIELSPDGDGAGLRLVSELSASSALLRVIADIARPVVQFGHDWVLDTGLRQFADRAL
ncbi:MAG: SRPBCC family protein [Acidimicrobiales bacterium]